MPHSPLQIYRRWRYANDLRAQLRAAEGDLKRDLPKVRGMDSTVPADGAHWSIRVTDTDPPELVIEQLP